MFKIIGNEKLYGNSEIKKFYKTVKKNLMFIYNFLKKCRYAKGMSNRDIEDHLNNLYGIDVSPSMISKTTDKIIPEIREWQSRQLEDVYPIVFMDAIHYSVRKMELLLKRQLYFSYRNRLRKEKRRF